MYNHFQMLRRPAYSKASVTTSIDFLSIIPIIDPKWALDIYISFSSTRTSSGPSINIFSSSTQLNKLALASLSNTLIYTIFIDSFFMIKSRTPLSNPMLKSCDLILSNSYRQRLAISYFLSFN